MAGLAGGAMVLLGGYAYYHFSDLKKIVDGSTQVKNVARQVKDSVVASASSSDALNSIRRLIKSYSDFIPGLGNHIDKTFDEIQGIVDKHGDHATDILNKAHQEVRDVVKNGGADVDTARKLSDVLGKSISELRKLGEKAGMDILQNNPEVKKVYDELSQLAAEKGPEAQRALEDVQKQLKDILANGANTESLGRARKLVQSKIHDLQETLEPAAKEAWDQSMKQAQKYLDKLPPGLKEAVTTNASALSSSSKDVFERVRKAAEARGGERERLVKDLQEYVQNKSNQTSVAWGDVLGYIKSVPGGEKMLDKVPNIQALADLGEKHGQEANKLAKETWDEVLDVLKSKGERAREIVESAEDEAKQKSK